MVTPGADPMVRENPSDIFSGKGGKMKKILLIVLAGLFIGGCAWHYTASVYPIPPSEVPDFKGDSSIYIINCCTTEGKILIGGPDSAGQTYHGDLTQFTATAVKLLGLELQKRGFRIGDRRESAKELKLAITNATLTMTYGSRCTMSLAVETKDGYKRTYAGYNAGWNYDRACDGAITNAVILMLNDKNIINYLQTAGEGIPKGGGGGSP
jgi:hypothetical protein